MQDKLVNFTLWCLARSQEPSTWAGVAVMIGAFAGHQLGDQTVQMIAYVGTTVGAALLAASTKH